MDMGRELAEQLVTTATQLLDEGGRGAVTIRDIARRCGVSHGAPRRHFPTLESLLAAVARQGLLDLTEAMAAHGCLLGQARAYVAFAERRPDMFELIFSHDILEGAGANLRELSLPLLADWTVQFRAQHPDASTDDALAAWAGVHGIATLAARGALRLVGVTPDRLVRTALRVTG